MQWVEARHPGLEKIPVPPSGHPSCEAILVDMGDDKAAQHKEHIHGQVALVHGSGIAFGVNGLGYASKSEILRPRARRRRATGSGKQAARPTRRTTRSRERLVYPSS